VQRHLLGKAAAIALLGSGSAPAADAAEFAAAKYNWSGFYVGVTAGVAWGQYDPRTSTVADSYLNATRAAAVAAAGSQTIKPSGFVTGIEAGYNWQTGNLLLGLEADAQAAHLSDATSSGGVRYPGSASRSFVVTSYGNADWLFTARPRIGLVAPNNWLLYATGGLAFTGLQSDFSFYDNNAARETRESGKLDATKAGYVIGGGVEAPLTNRLSLKADYLHVGFANTTGVTTANNLTPSFPGQVFSHSSDLKVDLVRAGLNYRFGGADPASSGDRTMPLKAPISKVPPLVSSNWDVETGARLWLSSGRTGAPQAWIDVPPPVLASRLTYGGLVAVSGETFARADHASGFFIKGYLGAGGIANGHLTDEDFPFADVYSNSLSNASGHLAYATIDLGYNFLKVPGAKVGTFVGYNYYGQGINVYGCAQLGDNHQNCSPPFQPGLLAISEYDHFNSIRIGLSSEVTLADRLRLTAEAAYVPWVNSSGLDDHLVRGLLEPEASNSGDGVMLEAVLDYKVTDAWNIGVGGRYWAWNTNTGTVGFEFLTGPTAPQDRTGRYTAERYGAFVQTSYRWGDTASATAGGSMVTKAPVRLTAPMNWTGYYIGGHTGGGWSDARWSDPFGSTAGPAGHINVAGFGDQTHATGPLGGGQIGANWQAGSWVLGIQADAGVADIRGENTCFSGLGGINCQHNVNALGTVTGRAGYAWNRTLAYVKAGGAWTDTTYSLFGNTHALALGSGSTTQDAWGWTVGGGIEYALTNHWIALAEYDHIGFPGLTVLFPTVAVINTQSNVVRQSVDVLKLGVNYKFDFASL
jgi:opacity protein-like surface antigen